MDLLWSITKPILDQVQAAWDAVGDDLITVMECVFGTLESVFSIGLDGLLTSVNVTLDILSGDWEGAWTNIKDFGKRTFGEIAEWLKTDAVSLIEGSVGAIISAVKFPFEQLYDWLFGNSIIKDMINDPVDWLESTGKDLLGDAFGAPVDAAKDAFGELPGVVDDSIDAVTGAFTDVWNAAVGGRGFEIPGFSFSAPSWVPEIGGKGWGWDGASISIPKLAEGGIVDEATLSMIGEGSGPEAVMPLDKINQYLPAGAGEGGDTTNNFEIVVHADDGRDAGRQIKRELQRFDI